ncbi:hypothetical protein MHK_007051 [Candidatus Magnetomorum sp. HK-1]|nr:hypothetical protein MHK_007051 [Candidatus Magnetomorum sp. HK-1]
MKKKFDKKIVKGIITPAAWKNDTVVEISIHTTDEEEFIVEHNDTGREMFSFIHYPVEVSGHIKPRISDGKMIISVEKCVTTIASNNDVFI